MGGNGKRRWKIFHRSSNLDPKLPPKEFTCPITGCLMSDPVVVASGQTFERLAVQLCHDLKFSPNLHDGTRPDFSTLIPNLALKTTILNWCRTSRTEHPPAPDHASVERRIREAMEKDQTTRVSDEELLNAVADTPPRVFSHAATELGPRVNHFNSASSSEESVIIPPSPGTPLPLTIRPTCFSSSSSGEIEIENPSAPASEEEESILKNLKSSAVFEQEEGVIALRKVTRSNEEVRVSLCTPRVLLALRGLIASRYGVVQVNAVASLVNLSLEKQNKVRIVRSGFVPLLVDVLKEGLGESQEHAAGALFSLALNDDNKMAIGVLGALQPLMHALRAESERTRHDSALALYHLSLVQSNRVKLVKLGVIPTLLSMVAAGDLAGPVLLILCNLAVCTEGRTAMLDANAVECLVGLLRGNELDSVATRENCVAALYALSHRSLRFKGLAKDARVVEVLKEVEETGTERAREKARKVLYVLRTVVDGDGDEGDEFFESAGLTRNRYRVGPARSHNLVNTTTF
ncbi:U-box domain-containing protein 38 [Cajanus cajan]|uniref:U-box domain-containing protein 38 n=1 Tax=Cajanus cajan TaxID=3821 RepID=UPI00098D9C35|nr:U-box domain-containing protein 38 [Cajanus cajan]